MPKPTIFVLQHRPVELPDCFADRTIYRPIQCGAAINPRIPDGLHDDEGDNISSLNLRYNEMTAIYWVAKHYDELGDPEYVGFDHYRRFLNWRPEWLAPDQVVARRWFSWRPLRNQYACCHDIRNLDRYLVAFDREFGAEYSDWRKYWRTHRFYICNVFVMHRDRFRRYAEFILRCIALLQKLEAERPFDGTDAYQRRTPSFILEAMTSFWLWHENRHGKIKIVPSTITHYNIRNEANGSRPVTGKGFLWFLRQAY